MEWLTWPCSVASNSWRTLDSASCPLSCCLAPFRRSVVTALAASQMSISITRPSSSLNFLSSACTAWYKHLTSKVPDNFRWSLTFWHADWEEVSFHAGLKSMGFAAATQFSTCSWPRAAQVTIAGQPILLAAVHLMGIVWSA